MGQCKQLVTKKVDKKKIPDEGKIVRNTMYIEQATLHSRELSISIEIRVTKAQNLW